MKRLKKVLFTVFTLLCVAVLLGPFLVPVSALTGLRPERELADSNSRFIEVNDVTVHYKEMGTGGTALILLHGFGASVDSWREVMGELSRFGRVIAYDRPAFGLTERPMPEAWSGNPYGMKANIELLRGLMDALKIDKAILVGNSAGGGVAVAFGLEYPERVSSLILVDPGVGGGRGPQFPSWALPVMWTPQMRHVGQLMMRNYQETLPQTIQREWFDQAKLTEEIKQQSLKIFQIKNWDRALYELTFAPAYPELRPLLPKLTMPVFIVAGAEDRLIRSWYFEAISSEILSAKISVIPACGHVPQEECPDQFMNEILKYMEQ